jgi:transposase-like protein
MTKAKQVRLVSWRLKVRDAAQGERRVARTCRRFGISRKTFYKWKKRYDTLGLAGIGDRTRFHT